MAALSLQSQPFPEVPLLSVTHLPSQRLTRHALAILQLLTAEGDGAAMVGEDRRAQERKLLVDQITKLVLGILHLLNEGLVSPEHSAPFSEEDWLSMEREQRQLYSDLMADNDQTLGTLGSLTVKSEEVAAADLEEEPAEMSSPTRDLHAYSDPQPDPPKPELSESPALSSYHNPFLDTLKSGGLPTFPGASTYGDSTISSYMAHSTLTAFPHTSSTTAEAASMMGNGMADPYLGNSSDDFPVENKASVTIKQEASPPCLQPPEGPEEMNNNFGMVHTQHARQVSWKRCREATKTANMRGADLCHAPLLTAARGSEIPNTANLCTAYLPPAIEKLYDRKRFECPQCQKSFNGRAHLIVHQRVHTRERPYVCECGKTFTQSSSLFRHQRSHTGEKNHVCTVCGKAFTRRTYLLNHQRNHKEPI